MKLQGYDQELSDEEVRQIFFDAYKKEIDPKYYKALQDFIAVSVESAKWYAEVADRFLGIQ